MLKLYEDIYAAEYQTSVMKLSILYHDIAKPHCYRTFGSSAGHDAVELIDQFVDIYMPVKLYNQVLFYTSNHVLAYCTYEMKPARIATFLEQFKSVEQLLTLLQLASFDSRGRINRGVEKDIEHNMLLRALTNILAYSPVEWISSKDSRPGGEAIKNHIHQVNIGFVNEAISCCRARDVEE
jgi:tRNA nucleotidyltransferase (CCA-adding enzyme)